MPPNLQGQNGTDPHSLLATTLAKCSYLSQDIFPSCADWLELLGQKEVVTGIL